MENRNEALREIIEQDGHAAGQKGGLQTGKTNHQKEEIRFWMLRIQRNHDGAGSRGETGQRPERQIGGISKWLEMFFRNKQQKIWEC